MNFITYSELSSIICKNLYKIPSDIDCIIGIPRSGMLPATIISLSLNLPLSDLDSFVERRYIFKTGNTKNLELTNQKIKKLKKVLIVDDSCNGGRAIREAKAKVENIKDINFLYLACIVTENSKTLVDIYFNVCPLPRLFEWNFMHSKQLSSSCVDIDGVLCTDPTKEQNDDGKKYLNFIQSAPRNLMPTREIGCLVSCRLEKYRNETEYWLKKQNIIYKKLELMKYSTKEERAKNGNHGIYKGNIYKSMKNMTLFIESDSKQAKIISEISGKPVFCINNQTFYNANKINSFKEKSKIQANLLRKRIFLHIKNILKKVLPKSVISKYKKKSQEN